MLAALGVAAHLRREGRLFDTTPAAIEYARRIIHAGPETPSQLGAAAVAPA